MRALVTLLVLAPGAAHAGAFEILEQGAAATGMVGAFTGKADDASAIFYNPGGLAGQGEGLHLYAGTTIVTGMPSATIGGETIDATMSSTPLPTLYAAYDAGSFAAGIGLFTQFGLSVDWPAQWIGAEVVELAELRTVTINPTVSWRPTRWLGLGAGADIIPASVELIRRLDLGDELGGVRVAGNVVGLGFNVAAHARFADLHDLSIGVAYRSGPDLEFDEAVVDVTAPPELSATLRDTPATTTIPLPALLSVGVGVRPTRASFVQVQVDWHGWSEFDTLMATTPNPALQLAEPQEMEDTITIRLGGEVDAGEAAFRAGIGYDWSPVPAGTLSPVLPDADRLLVSAGGSWRMTAMLDMDLAIMGVFFRERDSELALFPAEYTNFALLAALSVQFGPASPAP